MSSSHVALRLVIKDSANPSGPIVKTVDCGNFIDVEGEYTDMVCNPYSAVIGFSGLAWSSNGGLTSITVMSVPVFGGVSSAQQTAFVTFTTYFDDLAQTQRAASPQSYNADDVPAMWETLTITSGQYPVIDSIAAYTCTSGSAAGTCCQIIITYKNTSPTSITYPFGTAPYTLVGTKSWTAADSYLAVVQTSDDSSDNNYIALNFAGNNVGSDPTDQLACGGFQAGDASFFEVESGSQTDPIPVFIDWDQNGGGIDAIQVHTLDYNGIAASQECIRDNDCP